MAYNIEELKALINDKKITDKLSPLYGDDQRSVEEAYDRLNDIVKHFEKIEKEKDVYIFSASGRTELSGNHTDHNNGNVLAASINLDKLALVSKRDDYKIVVYTDCFGDGDVADIKNLSIDKNEYHKPSALIRGVCAGLKERGYDIGGATVSLSNRVLIGSGLSSSASFESLIGEILNELYNGGKVSKTDIAIIGQYSENVYFGKPCGLMDQLACSVGGIISIDFKNPNKPVIDKIEYDFEKEGYSLMVVDAKGDHSVLTNEYSAIRKEMTSVAKYFGKEVCREITKEDVENNVARLREAVGDRAIMRAYHFFTENERVTKQRKALEKNDIKEYIKLMNESGLSSFMYLQNCFSITSSRDMGVALALMITKDFLKGEGACRVHGGGFAGTIEALIPLKDTDTYTKIMESVFGYGSVIKLKIRQVPVCSI